ncbi:alpha/beta hydrolase [Tomitella gaofuii]|uniref:alpha/beta hydrolase n=1 Tax=Tomitella gaofuii TaxID=2760083 RepID=UPI0015FDC5A4|nr:alpha/beta fold hydrolase [Tomitella gaofuii]
MSLFHSDAGAPTYLLVHGSGTSSFMWAPIQRALALRGVRSYAIDLPGHGLDAPYSRSYQAPQDLDAWAAEPSPLATITLEDNVEAVADAARRLREHGPVVLVGASLGGITIGRAASVAPELVDGLVYVSAWACVERSGPYEYMTEPEFSSSLLPGLAGLNVGDPGALGVGRANYRTADPDLLAGLKSATMAEVTQSRFLAFLTIMQPDESVAVMMGDSRVDPDAWGPIPRMFVRLTEDRSIPITMQDRMIREADERFPDNPFTVRTLRASHAGFALDGDGFAEVLLRP